MLSLFVMLILLYQWFSVQLALSWKLQPPLSFSHPLCRRMFSWKSIFLCAHLSVKPAAFPFSPPSAAHCFSYVLPPVLSSACAGLPLYSKVCDCCRVLSKWLCVELCCWCLIIWALDILVHICIPMWDTGHFTILVTAFYVYFSTTCVYFLVSNGSFGSSEGQGPLQLHRILKNRKLTNVKREYFFLDC